MLRSKAAQNLHSRGAGQCHGLLAIELLEAGDRLVLGHSHAHFAHIGGQAKSDLVLALEAVGHAGAVEVGRAVLDQRHGVLGCQHHVFELRLGRNGLHHFFAQFGVVAHKLFVGTQRVGHGGGALTHTNHHRATLLPALEGGGIHRRRSCAGNVREKSCSQCSRGQGQLHNRLHGALCNSGCSNHGGAAIAGIVPLA